MEFTPQGPQGPQPFHPRPRMRFAAEAYGNTALVYSGHGDAKIPSTERLLRLDLRTLRWSRTRVRNAPASLSRAELHALSKSALVERVIELQRELGAWNEL